MTIIFVSILLTFSQFVSIVLDYVGLGLSSSQFFSIFLDYVEICMEYIFIVLGAGSVCLNVSRSCRNTHNFVELGAGSVCLNFSQFFSIE